MNLQPVALRQSNPSVVGQTIQCSLCLKMAASVKADLDAPAGTYVCPKCEPSYILETDAQTFALAAFTKAIGA